MPEEGLKQRIDKFPLKTKEAYALYAKFLSELEKAIVEGRKKQIHAHYCKESETASEYEKNYSAGYEQALIWFLKSLDSEEGKKWHLSRSTPKIKKLNRNHKRKISRKALLRGMEEKA